MKFRDNSLTRKVDLQLAPMVDVVFLLLMYFVVSWNFAKFESEVNISVPKAEDSEPSRQSPAELVIGVAPDGSVTVNNQQLSKEMLFEKLTRVASLFPGQAVRLRGNGEAEFTHVMAVLDLCQKAGIWNVAFASDQPAKG
ncbi:MAG: biopolymer transporter ExbD [Verrucomicrobia bacterium]|nr:biopolymer transporter ExbD [Verrucomicrobiota bacterium]